MATYLIGDVQGCFLSLKALLEKIQFDKSHDRLVFLGDIVNRGPRSLETLRFLYDHSSSMELVLGNHEIFLISLFLGVQKKNRPHTLDAVLNAPDSHELMTYLRKRPLIMQSEGHIFVHAGILPTVSINDAVVKAHELSLVLQSDSAKKFLTKFYEKTPTMQQPLMGPKKSLRLALAYLTLIRMCDAPHSMDLSYTGTLEKAPLRLSPWFKLRNDGEKIYFGHWAALGLYQHQNYYCLDSGCAWGNKLTALRLSDGHITQVDNVD